MHRRWARYIAGDPALVPLIPWDWRQIPWEALIRSREGFPIDRSSLVQALLRQNADFLSTDPRLRANILSLQSPYTFTITTGQQPGWLTGPLYTIVKAAHAVQLAAELEQRFGGKYHFVPVFWIASEDHDAAEVRSIALSWESQLEYHGQFRGAVGRHVIEAKFPPQAQNLALQKYWQEGKPWEKAFRESMQALFAGTGLVWLSPDDPQLKALASALWLKEIEESLSFHAHAVAKAYLESIGETPCLHPRLLNLFWLSDTERRYPLPEEKEKLRRAAYEMSEALSPNVLLRPVFQEYILPNIAYVAGPGEVAYWLELLPVFTAFGVPMPVVYPRGHIRVLPKDIPPLPSGMLLENLWSVSQSRLRSLLAEMWGESLLSEAMEWWQAHRPPAEAWQEKPGFQGVARELQRLWQKWGEKLRRAALRESYRQYQARIEAVLRFRTQTEPEGKLQERVLNIHAFAPTDPTSWLKKMMKHIQLEPAKMKLYI
ncbi:MAG: bacillithiol biosynthesis BshC, partial [Bacteroidia bacterium]|nr:bacillithiol biosynthesis BshC [Bacteroidia bacterium]